MRKVFAILALLGMAASTAQANMLVWINDPATAASVSDQPTINAGAGSTGNVFEIWARPEADMTLANVSMNVVSSNAAVLNFTDVEVLNPVLGRITFPPPAKDILRYEFVNDPAPGVDPDQITNFGGFSVTNAAAIGAGMGPDTASLDSGYSAALDAFHIANVTYSVTGANGSSTDIFVQIGPNGINNAGGSSSQLNIVFGNAADPALNANDNRGVNSATYDARVNVGEGGPVNEPPVVDDASKTAFVPETIMHTFTASDDGGAGNLTWGNFVFNGPNAPAIAPTFDPVLQKFNWDTTGSLGGDYTASVTATDAGGLSDVGTLSIHLIPEPSSVILSLVGLIGMAGFGLRKRG